MSSNFPYFDGKVFRLNTASYLHPIPINPAISAHTASGSGVSILAVSLLLASASLPNERYQSKPVCNASGDPRYWSFERFEHKTPICFKKEDSIMSIIILSSS